jgi:glycosyltransferase involved in cell wall biosynthesis
VTRPLVSVLVPVRDESAFLADALASLSAQTMPDFQAIVVDDGSSDESLELARAHARGDRRFTVVGAGRVGLVPALERARALARAPYVARMDGDDVALPERLEVQVAALEAEGLDACGGGVRYFAEDRVSDGSRDYERWINTLVTVEAAVRDVFVECVIPNPTLLVRSDVLEALGGWRDCGWPEDYDLLLRLWAQGSRFRNVDRLLLRWRQHPRRISRVDPAYSLGAFLRCKVHHLRATLLREFEGVVVWGAGRVGKAFARELVRQGGVVRAFVDVDPRKVGQTVHGVRVVAVDDAPRFARAFAVGAVAREEARTRIRQMVAAQGRRDGVNFVAVA